MLPALVTRPENRIAKLFDDNLHLFDDIFDTVDNWTNSREDENNWYMSFDLPGFAAEDVNLTVENDKLNLIAQNRNRRSIQYMVSLPNGVEPDKIKANLENGVLNIVMPKAEKAKPRRIQIE